MAKDWRVRPLSPEQIEYALSDVQHLHEMQALLQERIAALGRTSWFAEESAALMVVRRPGRKEQQRKKGVSFAE